MKIAVAAGLLLAVLAATPADARRNDTLWDHIENRRDARRAGVIVGVVSAGLAGASARAEAERRYEECLLATGYDYECERRRYYDEQQARRQARRSGIVAGIVAREIVRD